TPPAPIATVAPVAATAVAPALADAGRGRAEIAEVAPQLGVEGVLEADRLAGRAGRRVTRPALAAAGPGRGRRRQAERHLAAGVDVVDPHLDLVAEVEHVLDPVDALAAPDLGDVEQPVPTGEDVDERAELGDVHHPALVHLPDLGGGRVEDQVDLAPGLLDRTLVGRADGHPADHAVIVDRDVGPGLGGDGVDDLALGPDDLAHLSYGDLG